MDIWLAEPRGPSAGDAAAGWQREPLGAFPPRWTALESSSDLPTAAPPGGFVAGSSFRPAGGGTGISQRVGGVPPINAALRARLPVLAPRSHHLEHMEATRMPPRLAPLASPAPPSAGAVEFGGLQETEEASGAPHAPMPMMFTPVLGSHRASSVPQSMPRGEAPKLSRESVPTAAPAPAPAPVSRKRAGSASHGSHSTRSSSRRSSTGAPRAHGEGDVEGGSAPAAVSAGPMQGASGGDRLQGVVEAQDAPPRLDEPASAGLLQVRDALLERTSALEAQLCRAQDESEAEDARLQRLAYALARETHRSEKMGQELLGLDSQKRALESEWLTWSALDGCGGLDLRTLELRAENDAMREELRKLSADSSQEEELAQLRSQAAFQAPLVTKLQEDLDKANMEAETLKTSLMALLHGADSKTAGSDAAEAHSARQPAGCWGDAESSFGDEFTLQISVNMGS